MVSPRRFLSVGSDSFGVMGSGGVVDREAMTAAFDALDAAVDAVAGAELRRVEPPRSGWRCWSAASGCAGGYRPSSIR